MRRPSPSLLLAVLLCTAVPLSAHAQQAPSNKAPTIGVPGEPAFVEHRLALQISDASPEKQALILSVANNVLKVFGPDKVAIEVVAFGPGIALLRNDNPKMDEIASLVQQGVHFDACMNSMATYERKTGKPFPLNPKARKVPAGIVRLLTLAEHGYTVIRP
jgi:uncharacterized protein